MLDAVLWAGIKLKYRQITANSLAEIAYWAIRFTPRSEGKRTMLMQLVGRSLQDKVKGKLLVSISSSKSEISRFSPSNGLQTPTKPSSIRSHHMIISYVEELIAPFLTDQAPKELELLAFTTKFARFLSKFIEEVVYSGAITTPIHLERHDSFGPH